MRWIRLLQISRVLLYAMAVASSGCDWGRLPAAPILIHAATEQASVRLAWIAPFSAGQSAIASYTATCQASGEHLTVTALASPATLYGLNPGTRYACAVTASNASGTGSESNTLHVLVRPQAALSFATVYRNAPWAKGMSVTFPSECVMTLWPAARPNHAVDDFYLSPPTTGQARNQVTGANQAVARTAISRMPLVVRAYEGPGRHEPIRVNICPRQAPSTTPTNAGVIGLLVSGATLYKAAEITGHRATALNDNVAYSFKGTKGQNITAHFLDTCGGHPTPADAGNSYHYHGYSSCVTSVVDHADGPSHMIGVALDGFPIYGDRDIHGRSIDPTQLDGCNGLTSPTPEFPQGIYHYVLPRGITQHHASMRCYGGHVPAKTLAAAQAAGFCYASEQAPTPQALGMGMPMLPQTQKR